MLFNFIYIIFRFFSSFLGENFDLCGYFLFPLFLLLYGGVLFINFGQIAVNLFP